MFNLEIDIYGDINASSMSSEKRNNLPDSDFGLIQNKDGQKMRRFPLNDEKHVRMAWDMADRGQDMSPDERASLKRKILQRAKEMGMDTSEWDKGDGNGNGNGSGKGKGGNSDVKADACTDLEIEAAGLKLLPGEQGVNRAPFAGTMFLVDEPSDRPPHGTNGKKLYIDRVTAQTALKTIVGMPVNSNKSLDDHAQKVKVGVITAARIVGNGFNVEGHLFDKDFPQEVAAIRAAVARNEVGMSLESTRTLLQDYIHNGELVAKAVSLVFTGAAILLKTNAAYGKTDLAASEERSKKMEKVLEAIAKMKTELTAHVDTTLKAATEDLNKKVDAKLEEIKAAAPKAATPEQTKIAALEKEIDDLKASKGADSKTIPPEVEKYLTDNGLKIATVEAGKGDKGEGEGEGKGKKKEPDRKTARVELLARFGASGAEEGDGKELTAAAIDALTKKAGVDNVSAIAMKLTAMKEGLIKN